VSTQMQDRYAALKAARIAVHEHEIAVHLAAVADLRLDEPDASITALTEAEHAICYRARDLARAVDALPPEWQPKKWRQP
jgi:hypothetical protein